MQPSCERPKPNDCDFPDTLIFQLLTTLPLWDARALALTHNAAAKVWRLERLWKTRLEKEFGVKSLDDESALQAYKDEINLSGVVARDLSNREFLGSALRDGCYFYIWCALRRNFDVLGPDEDKTSLIISATERGDLKLVKRLIHHGASPTDVAINGFDESTWPLDAALQCEHPHLFAFFLKHETKLCTGGKTDLCLKGRTWALQEAFRQDKIDNVNARDFIFGTMLECAVNEDELASVVLLLHHGADPLLKGFGEKTVLDMARARGFKKVTQYLEYIINNKS